MFDYGNGSSADIYLFVRRFERIFARLYNFAAPSQIRNLNHFFVPFRSYLLNRLVCAKKSFRSFSNIKRINWLSQPKTESKE